MHYCTLTNHIHVKTILKVKKKVKEKKIKSMFNLFSTEYKLAYYFWIKQQAFNANYKNTHRSQARVAIGPCMDGC